MLLLQDTQYNLNMLQVFLPCADIDENVIEEYQHKLPQLTTENVVHTRLECGRSIGQPKGHHQELKVTVITSESGLGNILLPQAI